MRWFATLRNPCASRRVFSMTRSIASVPPLLVPCRCGSSSKSDSTSVRHDRSVRPSRVISGTGHGWKLSRTRWAMVRPAGGDRGVAGVAVTICCQDQQVADSGWRLLHERRSARTHACTDVGVPGVGSDAARGRVLEHERAADVIAGHPHLSAEIAAIVQAWFRWWGVDREGEQRVPGSRSRSPRRARSR
jgi:hypothetical protein